MLIALINLAQWTITGSFSFTPTTIQTSSNYTITLNLVSTIPASGYIQIVFPSDFDFSSEGTSSVTKTCSAVSGFSTSILFTDITCTLDPATNTLKAKVRAATTANTLQFVAQSIINPTYAKATSSIVIYAMDASETILEVSDSSFKVTATSGTLTTTLASADDIVGSKKTLTVTLAMSHYIPETGTIILKLPKWNSEDSVPESVLTSGSVGCTAISGFVKTNAIYCTFTQDAESSTTPDKLTVTGQFNSTSLDLSFSIANFRNPPSLSSFTNIAVKTSTSDTTQVIDQQTDITLPLTQVASLDSSSINITITNTDINVETEYTFSIQVGLPLPSGSSIELTFPSTVTPASSGLVVTGTSNMASDITESYDSATRVLTLTNISPTDGTYVDEGSFIKFTINLVTNPSNTNPSGDILYSSFDASGNGIESCTSGVTVTATPGDILSVSITPTVTTIRELTSYTFSFQTANDVPVGAIIYVVFPTIIVASDRTSTNWLSSGTSIDTTNALCTVSSSKYLTITNGFGTSSVTAGTTIEFTVSDITNYDTTEPSGDFEIETQTADTYILDSLQTSETVTATTGTISVFTITPDSLVTGTSTTYTFTLSITNETILINSYFDIVFPSEIEVSDSSYSEGTCQTEIGLSGSISCAFQSSTTLRVSDGFTTSDFLTGDLTFTMAGITNPRSTEPSSSFAINVYSSDGYEQYSTTSGVSVTMTTSNDYASISLDTASEVNGAETEYTFSITLSNELENDDIIMITVPSEVTIVSPSCAGVTNLASSLTWSNSGSVINVTVSTGSTSTTISASSLIVFTISGLKNPNTLSTTSSFIVETLSSTGYTINYKDTDLTMTTTSRGSIASASAVPDDTNLAVSTNYKITFTPSNDLPQNAFIQIGIPEEISVSSGTTTMTWVSISTIEDTLTCTWSSANRIVTVNNGFEILTSYPASEISFYINSLTNPNEALTTESFSIQTFTSEGLAIDYLSSGVTYAKEWDSPCLTWLGSLTTCTSCNSSSVYPYLSSSSCVNTWPSSTYLDTDLSCSDWDSTCEECTKSSTQCTKWPTSPYRILYGYSCVTSCPRFYRDVNQECKLMTETILPFILIVAWAIYFLLLVFLKIMKSHTLFFSSLVSFTSFLLLICWIIILIYSFTEGDTLIGVLMIIILIILYTINIVWGIGFYQRYILKKDAFYIQWAKIYSKTKVFIQILSYTISFIMFRVSLCRLLSIGVFSAALHRDRYISRIMNIFSGVYIGLVLCFVMSVNLYSMIMVDVSDGAFYHHIISFILSFILAVMLIAEIISGNKINRFDSFLLKSTYNKLKYEIRKGKYENELNNDTKLEILHTYMVSTPVQYTPNQVEGKRYEITKITKAEVLAHIVDREECRDLKNLLVHYRHSELPSPTNEINLVKSVPKKFIFDPRQIKSHPSSPTTWKEARMRWELNVDDANVDWGQTGDGPIPSTKRKLSEINSFKMLNRAKLNTIRQPTKTGLLGNGQYDDSDSNASSNSEGSEEESSNFDEDNRDLANRAIKKAINVQDDTYQSSSSKSTVKHKHMVDHNISSQKLVASNHLKLTKLKRELNVKKRESERIMDQNKQKSKEKKELEERIKQLKTDIDRMLTGVTDTGEGSNRHSIDIGVGSDFIEQKGEPQRVMESKSTQSRRSDIFGPDEEENKHTLDSLLRATAQSKVTTDYWKKVRDRELGTAASMYRVPPLNINDEMETDKKEAQFQSFGSSHSNSKAMLSSAEDFFGPKKPYMGPISNLRMSIDSDNKYPISIENTDFFGNVLPSTMTAYNAKKFKEFKGEDDLNSRLPDIKRSRHGKYFQGQYLRSPNNYFASRDDEEASTNKPQKTLKKRNIPRPHSRISNPGNKTARASTPSELPNLIKTPRRGGSTNREFDNTALIYKRQNLDITNSSDLEKAYKNILPQEAAMLADTIEIRRSSRPSSSNYRGKRKKSDSKKFFKQRFRSSENRSGSITGSVSPRVTPMERRKKNAKKKNKKSNKSKSNARKKTPNQINFYN